ncbi:hypothetical protein EOM82_07670 [bacterium]|nr:hypothetical protein [bacterium]
MTKLNKPAIVLVYIFIFIATVLCFIQYGSYNAVAATDTEFSKRGVLEDLRSDSSFVEADYPFNSGIKEETAISVIRVLEYAYSADSASQGNYGLYFYVYNPKGINLVSDSKLNKVQLANAWNEEGKSTNYEKYSLKFCNKSNEAGNKNLFYKYQLVDHKSADGKTLLQKLDKSARRYDVSGIELLIYGFPNATDYPVAISYTYTGYAAGYAGAQSTLQCHVNELETITLEVNQTNYRTGVSSAGAGHQNELNSVYFSVGNKYFEDYGNLQKIKAEWWEYKTSPIFVTKSSELYNALDDYIGETVSSYNSTIGWQLYQGAAYLYYDVIRANKNYNGKNGSAFGERLDILSYLFPVSSFAEAGKEDVSADTLRDWIYNYVSKEDVQSESFQSDLFLATVDSGRTRGYNLMNIDADDTFNMLSYDSTDPSWWQKFKDFGFTLGKTLETGDDYYNVAPIYIVEPSDILGTTSQVSKRLMIAESDVSAFKTFYAAETLAGKKIVLFRYAVTDYEAENWTVFNPSNLVSKSDILYAAQQTVFFDFDIIDLTFLKEGNYTVIPAVSSPIDVIKNITNPLEFDKPDIDWELLLKLLGLIFMVLLLLPFLPTIIRFLIKVIAFPFKLIGKGFESLKKKRKNNYE